MIRLNRPKLDDEAGRLAALGRYRILDTPHEDSFDKITGLVRDVLDTSICAISLIAQDRQWFKSIQGLDVAETPREIAFCHHTIQKREPMVVVDATADPRFAGNPLVTGDPGIRSYAGVPLCTPDGYSLGSLCAIDTKPRNFSESQISILERFAGLVVGEMELRTIAHQDFLTGAATRRAFVQAVEQEVDRFRRFGRESSLLIFDIDHFKKINDKFGHPAGDDVLKRIAAYCQKTLNSRDIFGRLGGEEFGILLGEISRSAGLEIAEHLRTRISELRFSWDLDTRVTASFGVSALEAGVTCDGWIRQADVALYRAKRNGRNRVASAAEDMGREATFSSL